MPATLPKAKCGNRAVPPATGYMPPSSAWTRARTMIAAPPMTQARRAEVPAEYAPFHEPNSQPEPMSEVIDAQVAPISPISRLRPTSAGLVTGGVTDSVAMFEPSSRVRLRGPYAREVGLMVMIVNGHEKQSLGFISVTRVITGATRGDGAE